METALLGLIQGITEFLPISSSGHLTIFQNLFSMTNPDENLLLDLVLHFGTLLAVMWFFRADLLPYFTRSGFQDPEKRHLLKMVVIASIPTAIIGLGFKKSFEALFGAPKLVCFAFAVTGVILLAAHHFSRNRPAAPLSSLNWQKAVFIGIIQGLAITPGISRSGSTIAGGLFTGLQGEDAGRFSFLLMIPAVGGATLLECRKLLHPGAFTTLSIGDVLSGAVVSFLVGLASLQLLMMVLKKQRLQYFAYYLFLAAPVFYFLIK